MQREEQRLGSGYTKKSVIPKTQEDPANGGVFHTKNWYNGF